MRCDAMRAAGDSSSKCMLTGAGSKDRAPSLAVNPPDFALHVLPMNHDVRESSVSAKGSRPWPICPGLDVSSFAGVTVAMVGARCQQRHRHGRCELSSNPRLLLEKGSAPLEKAQTHIVREAPYSTTSPLEVYRHIEKRNLESSIHDENLRCWYATSPRT